MQKRILFLILCFFSITIAKENKELRVQQNSATVQNAHPSTDGKIKIDNKFTRQKDNSTKNVDKKAEKSQLKNDLLKIRNSLKTIKNPQQTTYQKTLNFQTIKSRQISNPNLLQKQKKTKNIYWDQLNGTPHFIFINSEDNKNTKKATAGMCALEAQSVLSEYADMMMLAHPLEELILVSSTTDKQRKTHLKYQQYFKGIKVWSSDLYLHFDETGQLEIVNGRYYPTPEGLDISFLLTEATAIQKAAEYLQCDAHTIKIWNCEKIIYFDAKGEPFCTWFVEAAKSYFDDTYIFIDAQNGNILSSYDNVQSGTPRKGSGVDLYGQNRNLELYEIENTIYMLNTTKKMFSGIHLDKIADLEGIILVADARNVEYEDFNYYYYISSNDPNSWPRNAVSLSFGFSSVYDYFLNTHNLSTLDDAKQNIIGIVNLGTNYNNAFWTGGAKLFCFGNGDGSTFTDVAGGFDIIAHEYGHGVTQFHSNLEYQFQSGALNEGFSDFIGVMAEFYTFPGEANWLIGEDLPPSSSSYACLRDLANPHNPQSMTSDYPDKMSEYYDWPLEQDNGGVHRNSTIPGHAFYSMSTLMSRDKVEKIIYRAYIHYLTRRSQFVDLRLAAIQAAKDLYAGQGVDNLVAQAFDHVEIYGDEETEPDPPYDPVSGDDFVLGLFQESGQVVSIKSDIPFQQGADEALGIYGSTKPSVTEDGSTIAYVDINGNVNIFDVQNRQNYQITEDGSWHNVAISPRADYVAVTPDPYVLPSVIGIINMNTDETVLRDLYIPTTTEGAEFIPEYADILDWTIEGGYLIYDCTFSFQDEYGNDYETWGIYLTSAYEDAIVALFQPNVDFAVGNPSFSSTRDNVITFDVIDYSSNSYDPAYYIYTYDLFSGEFGFIRQNENTFGHPSFSPDDKRIVFQDVTGDGVSYLLQAAMQNDGLNAQSSTIQAWVQPIQYPVWYAKGERPSDVVTIIEEGFDGSTFPPAGWLAPEMTSNPDYGWCAANITDHNFSDINPDSKYSAACGYDPYNQQSDRLFSPPINLTGTQSTLSFWSGYNSTWTTNYQVTVYLTQSNSLQPETTLWRQTVEGNDGKEDWQWRNVTINLAPFSGSHNVRILWEYKGRDGDMFALDDVIVQTSASLVTDENNNITPGVYDILSNYPNPFNAETTILFKVLQSGPVNIEVYNTKGQLVETLIDQFKTEGYHKEIWRTADLSSGLYFIRMTTPQAFFVTKTLLIK